MGTADLRGEIGADLTFISISLKPDMNAQCFFQHPVGTPVSFLDCYLQQGEFLCQMQCFHGACRS